MNQRDQVLNQIRASLQSAHLPGARATLPPRDIAGQGHRAEMIADFQRELEPLGGMSCVVTNAEEAIAFVLKLLREQSGQEILMWNEADLPVSGLDKALRGDGYARLKVDVPNDAEGRKVKHLELERAGAGITGAFAGLADTGTLALVTTPTQPRLVSLLPPMHIALLSASRLFPDMASFFAAHPNVTGQGSNLVFIAGPSRTADIELTLTRGVHGPKFLHVVILDF